MRLSIFGLGKLGLCTAACFAARGHQVWGYDADPAIMTALRSRRNPGRETGLDELLAQAWPNLTITADLAALVGETDISLIIVPTPSQTDGRFSNHMVEAVLRTIAPLLRAKKSFHVVDVVSTVMPGTSNGVFKPLLEELTGKKCGTDFGLVYNPEFIALGSVIHNFLNPDLVLIGASDERAGALVRELYQTTCANAPHLAVMSLINAEITKLSLNCFVTMKISFANELAAICEAVPGADVDIITGAMGADRRIGLSCLKGGLGFGGPCFPRDNLAFQALVRETGRTAHLSPQVVEVNRAVVERLFHLVFQRLPKPGRVALLGLSYKPGTHIVEESQALDLALRLVRGGYTVGVHDPQALAEARQALGDLVTYFDDPYACLSGTDAIIILTDWPIYSQMDWQRLLSPANGGPLVIDCWRLLKDQHLPGIPYLGLGLGAGEPSGADHHERRFSL